MSPALSRDAELRLLGNLCRALVKRGHFVQMRDAIPGLTITRSGGTVRDVVAYVVLSRDKRHFSWWRVDNAHPLTDVDGAAEQISAFLAEPAPQQLSS
ncbi:hypothetical protein AGRA3207_004074 [Actinomadura graeca]|uniref:Uncharacterized protein n=1 Tax=Actinomadura graeca TaxID=2750812 RepID=A0ABX8QZ47_9ACTN|nr:hypothetical protein [Actinomadura graeca]QXJ22987.1 hypothetical protein AGRA3207_004074 [Actinomadura graeca]